MFSKRKKETIVIVLAVIAISIESLTFLYDQFPRSELAGFLFDIGLTRWGWLPAFVLATSAIAGTLFWMPGNRVLQGFSLGGG